MTRILGISAFYHDAAAALVVNGEIVAAAQEERFSREKHDENFPVHAIDYCLNRAGLTAADLDYVAFYDKPLLKFERLLETYLAYAPRGFTSFMAAMPVWLQKKLYLRRELNRGLKKAYRKRYIFTSHHESHAASAFFPSPFEEAAILTMDGVGEWATATLGVGRGHRIRLTHEQRFPHSLGLLYSAFTYYCGFTVNSGEYKLMGLAPYGEPRYVDLILERLVDLKEDGSLRMDMDYFNYCQGLTMTTGKFNDLFGAPPRRPETPLTPLYMDVAASIQKVTEEIMLRAARHAHRLTGLKNLCLAGGVALNCVANGRILREGPFENIWIQPAAGDAGGALGAALFVWHQLLEKPRTPRPADSQRGSLLGPACDDERIEQALRRHRVVYRKMEEGALCDRVADLMAEGQVIGWFQGAMEFGPRALGARSILGDPRHPEMQTRMNVKVKFREGFRPFAPAVLRERAADYFEVAPDSDQPYMLLVAPVKESRRTMLDAGSVGAEGIDKLKIIRSEIPAVTHVDYSARIQTADPERHGRYYRLIRRFADKTGCPVVVNTSFNLGWDPIVCTPDEAIRTFMSCDIDALCLGDYLMEKVDQPASMGGNNGAGASDFFLHRLLSSPCCGSDLRFGADHYACSACRHRYPVESGIPLLYWPHERVGDPNDVTERVKAFYEETPFPNYDDHDSVRSLIEKSRRGGYARDLNDAIPYNSTVLEVGCGTGQLSNFLGISCRHVVGTDLCLNSLKLGEEFRARHHLARVAFVQMNLFRPCFKPEQFDVVLCNGVLHHTSDPFGGFQGLVKLVKPGGHIVIGLYNTWGRLMTDLRRILFRLTGGRARWLDPYLRSTRLARDKERAWFADQYRHPHESKHTMGEVLRWFERTGIEFVRGVPSLRPAGSDEEPGGLLDPAPPGTALDRACAQLRMVATGSREGGFYIMIGRRA
jgi:carbamoyltransferase